MLAIVIPFYKIEFFEATLSSLANQTIQNFHVYIGNDASPDDPNELILKYSKILNLTYKKFDSNLGHKSLSKQWERCISITNKEEWIMVLGDDDYLEKTVVERFYSNYPCFENRANVVRFSSVLVDEIIGAMSKPYQHPEWEKASNSHFRRLIGATRSSLSEYIFSREAYSKYKFQDFPLGWHSDDMAWLDFSEDKLIYTINDSTVFIRNSHLNISTRQTDSHIKRKAREIFFKKIIQKKINSYTPVQRFVILKRYEELKVDMQQFDWKVWFFLVYFYVTNFQIHPILRFVKRTMKK